MEGGLGSFPQWFEAAVLSESSSAGEAGGNSRRKPGGESCSSAPEHGWISALMNPCSVVKTQHSTAGPESGAVGLGAHISPLHFSHFPASPPAEKQCGLWGGSVVLAASPLPPKAGGQREVSPAGLQAEPKVCMGTKSPVLQPGCNLLPRPMLLGSQFYLQSLCWGRGCGAACGRRSSLAGVPAGYRRPRAACILGSVIAGNQLSVKQ